MDIMNTGSEFLKTSIARLKYYKDLSEKAFAQLSEEDFHYQPNSESNSIAVIIQHMSGNMLSRWTNFLSEDGEKEWRTRDDEFEEHIYNKQQLMKIWEDGWKCFLDALEGLKENDLVKNVMIRNEPLSVIDAIIRQVAHYTYHIGQIIYIGKILRDKDWKSLSIPRNHSAQYNKSDSIKDPAKKFK